jgi:hypothetical protein
MITAAHGVSSKPSAPLWERTQRAHENRSGSGALHAGPAAPAIL